MSPNLNWNLSYIVFFYPVVFFLYNRNNHSYILLLWDNMHRERHCPTDYCGQPDWQPSLTTVTQSSLTFHDLRLIHFNVSRMRRPGFLPEQERGTTSVQSTRAYTGFRSGSALFTSSACSCTWCQMVAALRTCRTWWHPLLTCLFEREWDPPAASDMNFDGWN